MYLQNMGTQWCRYEVFLNISFSSYGGETHIKLASSRDATTNGHRLQTNFDQPENGVVN